MTPMSSVPNTASWGSGRGRVGLAVGVGVRVGVEVGVGVRAGVGVGEGAGVRVGVPLET